MNSLKTLFVSAVLLAVLYGVYLAMNRGPEPTPPPEVAGALDGSTEGGGFQIEPGTQMRAPIVLQGKAGGSTTSTAPTGVAANQARVLAAPPKVTVPAATPKAPPKAAPPAGSTPASTPASTARQSFAVLMATVRGELDRNRLLDAYRMLSRRYRDPTFTPAENGQIERLLDQLAGTVIYSTEHYIERPHLVGRNETLEQIARRYKVPLQLLAKINGLVPSRPLQPGSQIKVVSGPFSAEINLAKHELTLRLPDGGYAGRFAVGVGRDVPRIDKSYRVYDKIETPPGPVVTPGAASSGPLAKQKWIGLEGRLGIHVAANPADIGRSGADGGITLRAGDVDDLYDILSVGSQVVIRR